MELGIIFFRFKLGLNVLLEFHDELRMQKTLCIVTCLREGRLFQKNG